MRAALEAVAAAVAETGATSASLSLRGVFEPLAALPGATTRTTAYAPRDGEPFAIESADLTVGSLSVHCQRRRPATAEEHEAARDGDIVCDDSFRAAVL